MPKYLITAKVEVLQHASVEADDMSEAMYRAHADYDAARRKLHWSTAESFDPPSFMIESADTDDDDFDLTNEDDDEEPNE